VLAAAVDKNAAGIFNLADDQPAPPQDVVAFAAALMGVEPPPEVRFDKADLSPMARSFYGENKRVSNMRIKQELAVGLRYPTYREGLTALWKDGIWRG
ncbi:MAG: NAD(P)-dependent oxidoreductase, partial [Bauldia sp.]|nr:NAD(P)-dependent oxidoreductase [Bauldia sp.]